MGVLRCSVHWQIKGIFLCNFVHTFFIINTFLYIQIFDITKEWTLKENKNILRHLLLIQKIAEREKEKENRRENKRDRKRRKEV